MSVVNDMYGNGGYGDFSIEDLNDNNRYCPNCGDKMIQTYMEEHDKDVWICDCGHMED